MWNKKTVKKQENISSKTFLLIEKKRRIKYKGCHGIKGV